MDKKRAIITTVLFLLLIFGFGIFHLLLPDAEASRAERRELAQAPTVNADTVFSGKFSSELENYLLDQFPLRQEFVSGHKLLRYYVLGQRGLDNMWLQGDSAFESDTLKEGEVQYAAQGIGKIAASMPEGVKLYYAVIPDKGAFAEDQGQPTMDYDKLFAILDEQLPETMTEISIWDTLSFEDYYLTDLHWKQESIYPTAQALAEGMGAQLQPFESYTANTISPFYGSYFSRSGKPLEAEELTFMTSRFTSACKVTGKDFRGVRQVYMPQLLSGMDGYDVYLSGVQSLLTIEVNNAPSDRELIIFRDSFGSSIAPYFLGAYSKVTLIDLRSTVDWWNYVDLTNQDVLFLYSTKILNNGSALTFATGQAG